ncbi:MAG: hypothetical protein Q7T83_10180 [Thermodesulfovibrionales bacterium]|nr:hypothetical protein [Thermodesulfovibrionales bacterium]
MQEFEYDGQWWLPENSENKISGTLKFHPVEGAYLELIGSFKEYDDIVNSKFSHVDIILGITTNNKLLTLYKCFLSKAKASHSPDSSFVATTFFANVVFIGCHFEKGEDILFDSLSINYSHLEDWTGITGFRFARHDTDEQTLCAISYKYPQKVEADLGSLKIVLNHEFTYGGPSFYEYNLKQTTYITMQPNQPMHFNGYKSDICYHIQNFLSLATGKATYPLAVKAKSKENKKRLLGGKIFDDVYEDIFIFFSLKKLPDLSKKPHPSDVLFSYSDIADSFEKYLQNWVAKAEILRPVYDLYFGTLYNPSMYLEYQFLSLIQAVESYHRRKYGGQYLSDDDYSPIRNELIKAISQNISNDFKESLKKRLQYLNEYSLRKRLKEIFLKYAVIEKLLVESKEVFIEDVVNTRNYLTHYDKRLEIKKVSGQKLYRLNLIIKHIIEICLLSELEMPEEMIVKLMTKICSYRYRNFEKW